VREPEHYDGLIDLDCEWRRDGARLGGAVRCDRECGRHGRVYSEGSCTNTAVDLGASDR